MPVLEVELPQDKLFQRVPLYLYIAFHPGLLGWNVDTDLATVFPLICTTLFLLLGGT
jgi:hypothetical protein